MFDISKLRAGVEQAIDEYVYSVPRASVGLPWTRDKVAASLKDMRASLVDPFWVEIILQDTLEQIDRQKALHQDVCGGGRRTARCSPRL